MPYQIDQSGKIEDTAKDTILAISNGVTYTILLKAKDKRVLQNIYRHQYHKNRQYIYEVFSALLYLLIHSAKATGSILIDKEYPGQEPLIKLLYLSHYIFPRRPSSHDISFGLVGKSSPAHRAAYQVFKKKKLPQKTIRLEELNTLLFSHKKRSGIPLLTEPRALKHRIKRRVSSHPDQ